MHHARIVATYDTDTQQKIIIACRLTDAGHLQPGAEGFGYVTDWEDDEQRYAQYPFILQPLDNSQAALSWGAFDTTQTTVDIMGRRLVAGEKLVRREANERYAYTIISVRDD